MSARTIAAALILSAVVSAAAAPLPQSVGAPSSPGAAGSETALTPELLKGIDAGLTRAETIVLEVEVLAKGGVDGSGCPASMTADAFTSDLKNKRAAKLGNDIPDSADKSDGSPKQAWQMYFLCKAMAEKNPAACDELSALAPGVQQKRETGTTAAHEGVAHGLGMSVSPATYDGKCKRAYTKESARAAYIARSPQFMALCRQDMIMQAPAVKGGPTADAICSAWGSFNGDSTALAAAISNGVSRPISGDMIEEIVNEMTANDCTQFSREVDRRTCVEEQDYRKALATKNAGACRGGLCRVLMGEGARACESYAAKFKAPACAQGYAADYVATRAQWFKEASDKVESDLSKSDAGIGDPKALKEYNERLDKLSDLRARFDRASEKISPTINKQSEPRSGKKAATAQ